MNIPIAKTHKMSDTDNDASHAHSDCMRRVNSKSFYEYRVFFGMLNFIYPVN